MCQSGAESLPVRGRFRGKCTAEALQKATDERVVRHRAKYPVRNASVWLIRREGVESTEDWFEASKWIEHIGVDNHTTEAPEKLATESTRPQSQRRFRRVDAENCTRH